MLPAIASAAARVGLQAGARSATSSAVTSAARSGAVTAGSASRGSRLLSAAQFGSTGYHAGRDSTAPSAPAAPPATNDLGWMRS